MHHRIALVLAVLAVSACRRPPDIRDGGTELVYAPDLPAGASAAERQQVAEAVRERLAKRIAGAKLAATVSADAGSVHVLVPAAVSAEDQARLRELVTRRGLLELRAVDDTGLRTMRAKQPEGVWLAGLRPQPGEPTEVHLEADSEAAARGALVALRPDLPADRVLGLQPADEHRGWSLLLLGPAALTGDDFVDAFAALQDDAAVVNATLRPEAAAAFEDLTRRLVGHRLAVVVDGTVLMAPYVQGPIPGGRVQITLGGMRGKAGLKDATALALVLKSRSTLPVELRLVSERQVTKGEVR
jgi:preprotein translocase subunit SecD